MLPTEADVAFFRREGYWVSGPVVAGAELARLRDHAMQVRRGVLVGWKHCAGILIISLAMKVETLSYPLHVPLWRIAINRRLSAPMGGAPLAPYTRRSDAGRSSTARTRPAGLR
jgi:hypothetical protein